MNLSDDALRAMLKQIETTRSYWGFGEDGKYRDLAKTETVKAMAEELLAARAYFQKQKEYVEKIRVGLEELDKHGFSDYGSSGMPAKIEGEK